KTRDATQGRGNVVGGLGWGIGDWGFGNKKTKKNKSPPKQNNKKKKNGKKPATHQLSAIRDPRSAIRNPTDARHNEVLPRREGARRGGLRGAARRGSCAGWRKRRGQIHADEDPRRSRSEGRRRDQLRRARDQSAERGGGPGARRQPSASGIEPRAEPDGRRKHLRPARAAAVRPAQPDRLAAA